jgi:hypothetical protein
MPMHDWTKVKPNIYHMLHGAWLYSIARALNNGVLPSPYYALAEQRVAGIEADVLNLRPTASETSPPLEHGATKPAVALLARAKTAPHPPGRRITVRDADHEVVAVIELVSPGNTKDRENYAAFVGKAADLLWAGVHFLAVNPFRPPRHARGGLHSDIWKMVARRQKGQTLFKLPADRPLLAVSYCAAADEVTAAVQPFAVGKPVPDIPLYLRADEGHVTLPLEATYRDAFPELPRVWREVLEG